MRNLINFYLKYLFSEEKITFTEDEYKTEYENWVSGKWPVLMYIIWGLSMLAIFFLSWLYTTVF